MEKIISKLQRDTHQIDLPPFNVSQQVPSRREAPLASIQVYPEVLGCSGQMVNVCFSLKMYSTQYKIFPRRNLFTSRSNWSDPDAEAARCSENDVQA